MSDKDEIKELFQRELGNYEAKVDPSIWSGVQSGLSSTAAAASSSLGVAVKIAIAIATSAVIGTGAYYFLKDDKAPVQQELAQEKEIIEKDDAYKKEDTEKHSNQKQDLSIPTERTIPTDSIVNIESKVDQNNYVNVNDSLITEQVKRNKLNAIETTIDQTKSSVLENKSTVAMNDKKKTSSKSLQTTVEYERSALELKPFIERQENQRIKFGVEQENIVEIYWDFGDGNISQNFSPEHFYDRSGEYNVTVRGINGDQEVQKTLRVKVEVEGKILNLPNVFTPNRDGQNDYFFIESEGLVDFQITIMNASQEVVFQSNDPSFKWNGLLQNGIFAPSGNYVYIVIASDRAGNTINKYQRLRISRD